jgi:hypothetical protein
MKCIADDSRLLWIFFATSALSAFVLNWLWEMFQMPLFVEMAGRSWLETALPCARAALGDVVMAFSIYGLGALAARNWFWGLGGGWNVYLTGALLGGVFAAAYEWNALASDRWSYSERMPIVPILDVGLWPLLQLPLLVPASWAIARWWTLSRSTTGG